MLTLTLLILRQLTGFVAYTWHSSWLNGGREAQSSVTLSVCADCRDVMWFYHLSLSPSHPSPNLPSLFIHHLYPFYLSALPPSLPPLTATFFFSPCTPLNLYLLVFLLPFQSKHGLEDPNRVKVYFIEGKASLFI